MAAGSPPTFPIQPVDATGPGFPSEQNIINNRFDQMQRQVAHMNAIAAADFKAKWDYFDYNIKAGRLDNNNPPVPAKEIGVKLVDGMPVMYETGNLVATQPPIPESHMPSAAPPDGTIDVGSPLDGGQFGGAWYSTGQRDRVKAGMVISFPGIGKLQKVGSIFGNGWYLKVPDSTTATWPPPATH